MKFDSEGPNSKTRLAIEVTLVSRETFRLYAAGVGMTMGEVFSEAVKALPEFQTALHNLENKRQPGEIFREVDLPCP